MKDRFIIFLDIDGVFNSELFFKERASKKELKKNVKKEKISDKEYYSSMLDKNAINLFNNLIEELECKYDVKIVISSTWRHNENLQKILNDNGCNFEIFSITPTSECRIRGVEIYKWLKDNINQSDDKCLYFDFYRYAIIDDDSDMLLQQQHNFFKTDNYCGLTPNICYRIKNFALHETF